MAALAGIVSGVPSAAASDAVPVPAVSSGTAAVPGMASSSAAVAQVAPLPGFDPASYGLAAAYAATPRSGRELYAWNADKAWPVASLSKLVSALVWKNFSVPWSRIVTLQSKDEVGGGRLRVPVGTKIRFEDLWYASLTASANNAAMAVARSVGVTPAKFVALMNREASRAGAKNAVFYEPSGMNEKNVATAREMAALADRAFQWRPLQKAASTANYTVHVLGPKAHERPIHNTNELLLHDPDVWVIAGKTGYLEESRHDLVAWLRPVGVDGKPETGKDVLVVVYGAPTKEAMFASAKALAQSIWHSHATDPSLFSAR